MLCHLHRTAETVSFPSLLQLTREQNNHRWSSLKAILNQENLKVYNSPMLRSKLTYTVFIIFFLFFIIIIPFLFPHLVGLSKEAAGNWESNQSLERIWSNCSAQAKFIGKINTELIQNRKAKLMLCKEWGNSVTHSTVPVCITLKQFSLDTRKISFWNNSHLIQGRFPFIQTLLHFKFGS